MAGQVVVTGAGQGLGMAIVDVLVDRGWDVWATDVSPEGLANTAAQHHAVMDVADPKSVASVMAQVDSEGGIDAVVNIPTVRPRADM